MTRLRPIGFMVILMAIAGCSQELPGISGDIIWEKMPPLDNAHLNVIELEKSDDVAASISLSGTIISRDKTTNNYAFVRTPVSVTLGPNGSLKSLKTPQAQNMIETLPPLIADTLASITARREVTLYGHHETKNGDVLLLTKTNSRSLKLRKNDTVILRVSSSGDILWEQDLKNTASIAAARVTELKDGSFLMLGQSRRNRTYETYVRRLSSTGDLLWERIYEDDRNRFAYDTVLLKNGNFVMAGVSLRRIPNYARDADGQMITPDGTPYVIDKSPSTKSDFFALCLDTETGEQVWSRNYANYDKSQPLTQGNRHTGEEKLVAALRLKGDRILLAGSITGGAGTFTDLYLMAIDKNGEPFWKRRYGGYGVQVMKAAEVLDDGNVIVSAITSGQKRLIIGGTSFNHIEKTATKPWILKLDMGLPKSATP